MPGRKSRDKKNPKNNKISTENENLENQEETTTRGTKKRPHKNKKDIEDSDVDELSELDIKDEDVTIESDDNDEIISSHAMSQITPLNTEINRQENISGKKIDPDTPIGSLKTIEIINYLIQVGTETLNPQLKSGAISLLRQLTGRRPYPTYGSKRGSFGRGFIPRGRGRSRGMPSRFIKNIPDHVVNSRQQSIDYQENLYDN